jgi:hypothetical protein
MRGPDKRPGELFSYVDLEQRVRFGHPLRAIRALTDAALEALSGDFAALYSGLGRPPMAQELFGRALLHAGRQTKDRRLAEQGRASVAAARPASDIRAGHPRRSAIRAISFRAKTPLPQLEPRSRLLSPAVLKMRPRCDAIRPSTMMRQAFSRVSVPISSAAISRL